MKKLILLFTLTLSVLFVTEAQAQKVATVNTQVLIDTMPQKDSADLKLAAIAQVYDEKLRDLQMEMQNKQKEFEAKVNAKASQSQLELLQKSYERLVQEYKETEEMGTNELQEARVKLLQPLIEIIKKSVGDVAKAKGYAHVIDNAQGIVLWSASPADDITAAVIAQLLKK
ncbi:MAG: OmpH family outer membrane protein [Bacteroidota bacterium]|jgi:Skp family chaperone for outer membrane proteins